MPKATWAMLVTESLLQQKTQFINRIPRTLLKGVELEQLDYLETCSRDGYIPKLDTFKEDNIFLAQPSELPLSVLHDNFTKRRRNEVMAEGLQLHLEENGDVDGITEAMQVIFEKTRIPNPAIIDYGKFDRTQLDRDIYRIATGISFFDDIFGGVLKGGEIVTLMAGTKVGKTTTLRLLAEMMFWGNDEVEWCPGVPVMIHSMEMSTENMLELMDYQRIGRNPAKSRAGISKEIMEEMIEVQKMVNGLQQRMFITPTVSTAQEIKDYYYSCEVKPKVIFVDGFNILGKGGDNSFGSIGAEMKELKEFAIKENLVIIGVIQMNRDGIKKGMEVDHTSISGSIAVAFYTDFLLSLSRQNVILPGQNEPTPHTYFKPVLCRPTACDPSKHFLVEFRYTEDEYEPWFRELNPNWSPTEDSLFLDTSTLSQKKESWTSELKDAHEILAQQIGVEAADELVDTFAKGTSDENPF